MSIINQIDEGRQVLFDGKIETGRKYTLCVENTDNITTTALQYSFKPTNSTFQSNGHLCVNAKGEATVVFPRDSDVEDTFKGISNSNSSISGQENEWILIFDKKQCELRKVDSSILNLQPVRSESLSFVGLNTAKSVSEARNLPQLLRKVGDKVKRKRKADELSSIANTTIPGTTTVDTVVVASNFSLDNAVDTTSSTEINEDVPM